MRCEECEARVLLERLQDEQRTSTRTRITPIIADHSITSFCTAFSAVHVFIILSVLGLHINLI